ncbi:MAG: acylphosphatase [Pirellulales bacterium]
MPIFAQPQSENHEGRGMSQARVEVLFSGRVQGVGFRYNACEVAERFRVLGYVRNLPDGTVRLVAEGEGAELDAFIVAVGERMSDFIRDTHVERSTPNGEFSDFSIRP